MTLTMPLPTHTPVLLNEVIEALQIKPGKRYVDCTLGLGGHTRAILEKSYPTGQLLGIDADPEAISIARTKLAQYSGAIVLVNDNFTNLENVCRENDFLPVDGILFDLGISSAQLEDAERGFSFQQDAQPDMRVSPNQVLTATDLINILPEDRLAQLIYEYGEERRSRQIARLIVKNRPVISTVDLANMIEQTVGYDRQHKIHPATKTFLALRIAVNHELENLETALKQTIKCLNRRGRLVVISYHSLEDRIVKQFMKRETMACLCPPQTPVCNCGHAPSFKIISKKVITPSPSEIEINPRSRSAKLRVSERL
jgi:16S rRNA (cytosine1402-N4)-methyltransferase